MVHDEVRVLREGVGLDTAVDNVNRLGCPSERPKHRVGREQLLLKGR